MSDDSTTLRVPKDPTHQAVKDYAEERGVSITAATTFLIEQGLRWNGEQEEVFNE